MNLFCLYFEVFYTISGWSSTQPTLSSYSSRFPGASNHTSGYLSQRPSASSYGHTSPRSGLSNTYQPSKYGLASESSYNSSLGDSKIRGLQGDNSDSNRPENGYDDKMGFSSRKYEHESLRNLSSRGTDYSSDSGHAVPTRLGTDYSSDSGMSYRRQSWKSSDFELDIPSPDVSRSHNRSQNDDELFHSPAKSQQPATEFLRYNGNHNVFEDRMENHLSEYRNLSRSEPNLDKYQNISNRYGHSTDEDDISPRQASDNNVDDDNHKGVESNGDDDDYRSNFVSPEMYQGDVADTTVAHRPPKSQPRNRGSDLTHWQQNQKSTVTNDFVHSGLNLKSSIQSPRSEVCF